MLPEDVLTPIVFDLDDYMFILSLPLSNGGHLEVVFADCVQIYPAQTLSSILNN